MYTPTPEQELLLSQAEAYLQKGDVYHAVKLFKLLVRKAPSWLPPYLFLTQIFKERKEWKALVHYSKKALGLDPSLQDIWWNLGIGSFILKKNRQANRIWNKFGLGRQHELPLVSVQIKHNGIFELIWVQPLSPVSGMIRSIPHPQSDRTYRDIIVFDRDVLGYNIVNKQKIPVFAELEIFKRSFYNTFSGIIMDANEADLELFEELAKKQEIGFEIWSNALRSKNLTRGSQKPEYFQQKDLIKSASAEHNSTLIALSGRNVKAIHQLIKAWEVISLKEFVELEQHH